MRLTADKARLSATEAKLKSSERRKQKVPEVLDFILKEVDSWSSRGYYTTDFYQQQSTNVFSCDTELLTKELEFLGFRCDTEQCLGVGWVFTVSWEEE